MLNIVMFLSHFALIITVIAIADIIVVKSVRIKDLLHYLLIVYFLLAFKSNCFIIPALTFESAIAHLG